jgi:peptidoglycan/xylan/chitin deacetylase (PgdA/CDA1 family)
MARQGCDVVDHGWRWLDYHGIDEATEREHICLSVETIRRLTRTRPIGWYIGTPSANTRRLVVEKTGSFTTATPTTTSCPIGPTITAGPI